MSETSDPTGQPQSWEGDDGGVMKGFINFLTYFDVVGPGEIIAVDAMLSVFTTKPALLDAFVFGGWCCSLNFVLYLSQANAGVVYR